MSQKDLSSKTLDSVSMAMMDVKEFRNELFKSGSAGAIVAQDVFDLLTRAQAKLSNLHETIKE